METVEINGREYFTATAVAEEVGVCRQTLWRWRQSGKISSGHRHRTGQVLFTRDEVETIRTYANRVVPIETLAAGNQVKRARLRAARE